MLLNCIAKESIRMKRRIFRKPLRRNGFREKCICGLLLLAAESELMSILTTTEMRKSHLVLSLKNSIPAWLNFAPCTRPVWRKNINVVSALIQSKPNFHSILEPETAGRIQRLSSSSTAHSTSNQHSVWRFWAFSKQSHWSGIAEQRSKQARHHRILRTSKQNPFWPSAHEIKR